LLFATYNVLREWHKRAATARLVLVEALAE